LRRKCDAWGCGHFGASRGKRDHNGIDFLAEKGSYVFSPIAGVVSKFGFPYADIKKRKFRYVEVVDKDGYRHRFMYVKPNPVLDIGSEVKVGMKLGRCQHIAEAMPGMGNHVHYEIKHGNRYVDPDVFWEALV